MPYQKVRENLSEVREKLGKMKVEKSDHPVKEKCKQGNIENKCDIASRFEGERSFSMETLYFFPKCPLLLIYYNVASIITQLFNTLAAG